MTNNNFKKAQWIHSLKKAFWAIKHPVEKCFHFHLNRILAHCPLTYTEWFRNLHGATTKKRLCRSQQRMLKISGHVGVLHKLSPNHKQVMDFWGVMAESVEKWRMATDGGRHMCNTSRNCGFYIRQSKKEDVVHQVDDGSCRHCSSAVWGTRAIQKKKTNIWLWLVCFGIKKIMEPDIRLLDTEPNHWRPTRKVHSRWRCHIVRLVFRCFHWRKRKTEPPHAIRERKLLILQLTIAITPRLHTSQ